MIIWATAICMELIQGTTVPKCTISVKFILTESKPKYWIVDMKC
jgi:hypothetical protein